MIKEIYKPLPGYETYILVSNYGKVKKRAYSIIDSSGRKYDFKEKELNQHTSPDGYKCINTSINGKTLSRFVHRLVGKTFHPLSEKLGDVINHLDGNRTNNFYQNLQWCTQSENCIYSRDVLGFKVSEKTKRKLSDRLKGVKKSKDHIEKVRQTCLRGNSVHAKKLVNVANGKAYDCIKSFADDIGVNYRTVLTRIRGGKYKNLKIA